MNVFVVTSHPTMSDLDHNSVILGVRSSYEKSLNLLSEYVTMNPDDMRYNHYTVEECTVDGSNVHFYPITTTMIKKLIQKERKVTCDV